MPSLMSRLVPVYIRLSRYQRLLDDPRRARDFLARADADPESYAPPVTLRQRVKISHHDRGGAGDRSDWPVYTLAPKDGPVRGTVVYAHGGAWAKEIVSQHWELCGQIATKAGVRVVVPIYPLAGRGTAAEVVEEFADIVTECAAGWRGAEPGPVCLAGDSAGGQIALSAAQVLRDRGHAPLPATVLISPAVELSMSNPDIDGVQPKDPWLAREGTRVFIEAWRAGLPITDPRVSPLCGDMAGLGPLMILAADRDIVVPDVRLLVEKARAAGVDVDYTEERGLLHVHPLHPTPEGKVARKAIVDTIRAAVTEPAAQRG